MLRFARTLLAAALAAVAAAAVARPAPAGRDLLVGVADDTVKWERPQAIMPFARDLGLKAIRITTTWRSGESRAPVLEKRVLDRAIVGAWGLRAVLAVYGRPDEAPRDDVDRTQYCNYVADVLRAHPTVNDVVIWNEPNVSRFWRPQFDPDGSSAAPAAYAALLARCWDTLHAVRPTVNVIAASSPRGSDNPGAAGNASHSPANWYRQLGAAYRSSGRRLPILDTIGHNPYPDTNVERPWTEHRASGSIGQGDYRKLLAALDEAFAGTAQPLPGRRGVSIWYMEQGFQSTIEFSKTHLYKGRETDRFALPPWSDRAGGASVLDPAPDQATQIADAVRLAYCQPYVGAIFNFELADETSLAGWQSGVLWADRTPKPSYHALKRAIADVSAGRVDCSFYEKLPDGARVATDPTTIRFTTKPRPKPAMNARPKKKQKVRVVIVK